MHPPNTPALIFGLVGALLCVGALFAFVRKRARLATCVRVVGTVSGYRVRRTRRGGRTRTMHHPLVHYLVGATPFTHESPVSTSQPQRAVGSAVQLLVDPNAPDVACIDEVAEKYFIQLLCGAIGAVFCGVAVWSLGRS
jgi:hypothetical protein